MSEYCARAYWVLFLNISEYGWIYGHLYTAG